MQCCRNNHMKQFVWRTCIVINVTSCGQASGYLVPRDCFLCVLSLNGTLRSLMLTALLFRDFFSTERNIPQGNINKYEPDRHAHSTLPPARVGCWPRSKAERLRWYIPTQDSNRDLQRDHYISHLLPVNH